MRLQTKFVPTLYRFHNLGTYCLVNRPRRFFCIKLLPLCWEHWSGRGSINPFMVLPSLLVEFPIRFTSRTTLSDLLGYLVLVFCPCILVNFTKQWESPLYSTSTDFGSTHSSHDPEIFPLSLRNCIATFHISSFRGSNTGNSYMHHFIFIFPEYIKHQFNALLCL